MVNPYRMYKALFALYLLFYINVCSAQQVYKYVEKMPYARYDVKEYLSKNLQYPSFAMSNKIEGKVIVGFVVMKDGSIDSTYIIQGLSADCDSEAIRIIRNMPKWIPAEQKVLPVSRKWRKVPARMTQPITFRLID